ncbi:MAG: hypothetical protein JXA46_16690 [Dehalococcoidales bacterium]|nr:hypothetical protein [Dehalococcoidales bacterium]
MSESTAKTSAESGESSKNKAEIFFKCKLCGELRPLSELIVIKNYYPHLSACKACARGVVNHEPSTPEEP